MRCDVRSRLGMTLLEVIVSLVIMAAIMLVSTGLLIRMTSIQTLDSSQTYAESQLQGALDEMNLFLKESAPFSVVAAEWGEKQDGTIMFPAPAWGEHRRTGDAAYVPDPLPLDYQPRQGILICYTARDDQYKLGIGRDNRGVFHILHPTVPQIRRSLPWQGIVAYGCTGGRLYRYRHHDPNMNFTNPPSVLQVTSSQIAIDVGGTTIVFNREGPAQANQDIEVMPGRYSFFWTVTSTSPFTLSLAATWQHAAVGGVFAHAEQTILTNQILSRSRN